MKEMSAFLSIEEMVKSYRDTKTLYKALVSKVQQSKVNPKCVLYRGDCVYSKFLEVGNRIRFYNKVSSWSADYTIAKGFANIESIPEWYFLKNEWHSSEPFPFEGLDIETLKPVIFELNVNSICGIRILDYIDVESDKEYVNGDEKEYIIGVTEFKIKDIKNLGECLKVVLLTIN